MYYNFGNFFCSLLFLIETKSALYFFFAAMNIFFLVMGSLPILGMSYDVRNVWEEQKRICKNKFVIYLETPSAALINPNLIKYENIGHGS